MAVLWQSSTEALLVQTREVSLTTHALNDSSSSVNVVTPLKDVDIPDTDTFDFNDVPYSCPAARRLLPISHDNVLVMGDEHTVLYTISPPAPVSPRISRGSISSVSGTATSPRANATRRSPQNEVSAPGKRRKSSMTAARAGLAGADRWELKPVWRVRQGFGIILA